MLYSKISSDCKFNIIKNVSVTHTFMYLHLFIIVIMFWAQIQVSVEIKTTNTKETNYKQLLPAAWAQRESQSNKHKMLSRVRKSCGSRSSPSLNIMHSKRRRAATVDMDIIYNYKLYIYGYHRSIKR